MALGRVSLFFGKGGVGRTTLASAFAVDRAAAGEKVLLLSVVAHDDPGPRIQHEAAGVDTGGRLELLHIDARQLVDDLVRRITRLGPMADIILKNPSYESLVDIVPGVREMAIFHFVATKLDEGYDRIVLDAPATGHGIHFLEAPEKSARILAGPLRARAEQLRAMLQDPAVTDIVLVTLAEEMPVRETMELARALVAQGFAVDNIAVNKWLPPFFEDEGSRAVLRKLDGDAQARTAFAREIEGRVPIADVPQNIGEKARPAGRAGFDLDDWLVALKLMAAQRAEAKSHLAELRALDAKLSIIPLIPDSSRRLLKIADAMKAPASGAMG
ncbi:MAG TPA: ArsA family ATPase [Candidatus Thermoplasmatota archaeon]|nr:ArsA family ATPase [Candidatus Thermoplasmatota archaeon]